MGTYTNINDTIQMTKPSLKRLQLEVYKTTKMYNELRSVGVSPKKIAYQISALAEMIQTNQRTIESFEEDLLSKDPNFFVNLFNKHAEYRHKLDIQLRVRERLFERWDKLVKVELTF